MAENQPTLAQWRELYESAIRLKKLAPWKWMSESDIFAVKDPDSERFGFPSVMGMVGEHFAVTVYLGAEGLYRFWELEGVEPTPPADWLLEIPQLQVSFEDRGFLEKEDREVVRELGLSFRGRNAWPRFRSFRPGFLPWFLDAEEARFLACILAQVVDVVPRARETPSLLARQEDMSYFARMPSREENGEIAWNDGTRIVLPPASQFVEIAMDLDLLEKLKRKKRGPYRIEMDLFLMPTPVREEGGRPYYPYTLLLVEGAQGKILGLQALKAEADLARLWGNVPAQVAKQLSRMEALPGEISVRSSLLYELLERLAGELGIDLRRSKALPELDSAKRALFQHFTRSASG